MTVYCDPKRKHDFVLLFDVTNGNPNGDPDAANMPRIDPETMRGLVTDVAIKRKVRNYVDLIRGNEQRFKIYIQSEQALNTLHQRAYDTLGIKPKNTKRPKREEAARARKWMCDEFYDVRMFGAMMTTEVNAGQVRGPMQLTFAQSVDTVSPIDVSITRIAITKESEMQTVDSDGESGGKVTEMGRKYIIPYGLYVAFGFFSAPLANQTGVTEEDLELFWTALQQMWEFDRSAAKGMMSCRGLYVFSHESPLGNAPSHALFEHIRVNPVHEATPPRSFGDYTVDVDRELPAGVHLNALVS